ncbi:MAG: hypothetical protein NT001_00150 [Candidatus Woesearchaeota archaeon]|nr:hypothetical protein [Candidatus Woesearchaeota archaeon]
MDIPIKRMNRSKKSQLEIIGIAIVVVIIVLGFLFVIKAMSTSPSSVQASFVRAHIAQDVLNAISISDANCGGMDMTELLKACVEGETEVECGKPCIVFKDSVDILLKSTLEVQKLPYRFRAYEGPDPPKDKGEAISGIFLEYNGCNKTSLDRGYYVIKERPGWWIIPVTNGDVKVMLEICSRPY